MKKLRRWFRNWLDCRMKRCTYFEHYLAYGPAELTHEGYHAAEKKCEYWQLEFTKWLDAHPGYEEIPRALSNTCAAWEKRIRA